MKVIGFEEHYGLPALYDAAIKANDPYGLVLEALKKAGHFPVPADPKIGFPAGIYDLGEGRIAAMDDAGIDVQILSYATPSAERLEPSQSRGLTRDANDTWRLRSSSTRTASSDLPRCRCSTLRLQRASSSAPCATWASWAPLINGNVNGRFLDDKFFWPVLESAEALGVPIYLHVNIPPKPVVDAYYAGFAPEISAFLSIAGPGWHIENGIHCLRLILGGVFDRFPALQIIVGHNLEILCWMAWRADYCFPLGKEWWAETDHQGIRSEVTSTVESSLVSLSAKSLARWIRAGVCRTKPI